MRKPIIVEIIICFLLLYCLCCQPSIAIENPRYHYDVKIILISRMFDTIEIDGYHDLNEGFGFDDSILLKRAVRIRLFGLLIIYNNSEILEKNNHGGWIHTNIEMTRYSGWMVNQHNNKHLIMIGECDIIKITTGRI